MLGNIANSKKYFSIRRMCCGINLFYGSPRIVICFVCSVSGLPNKRDFRPLPCRTEWPEEFYTPSPHLPHFQPPENHRINHMICFGLVLPLLFGVGISERSMVTIYISVLQRWTVINKSLADTSRPGHTLRLCLAMVRYNSILLISLRFTLPARDNRVTTAPCRIW